MTHPDAARLARVSLQLATLREDVHVPALQRGLECWALRPPVEEGAELKAMLRALDIRFLRKEVEVRAAVVSVLAAGAFSLLRRRCVEAAER